MSQYVAEVVVLVLSLGINGRYKTLSLIYHLLSDFIIAHRETFVKLRFVVFVKKRAKEIKQSSRKSA